jgi:glycosyltransferase involved in cell wall biosynthesis
MANLALVMIARDEAPRIQRCLSSVRDHVDTMLVLDTGSNDDTMAIARRAGARVASYTWCDDFAAARNAALELADADWSLVLDADEWLADGAAVLRTVRALPPTLVGVVRVDSYYGADPRSASCSLSWLSRLLPRNARYEGRIHEQPERVWPRRRFDITVRHDGYLDGAMQRKHGRNERLLCLALAEHPHDAYWHYQLGKDLELQARYDEALPHYQQADAGASIAEPWRHDLLLRQLFTLKKLGHFEAAVQLAQTHQPRFGDSPDYCFALGDLLLDWAAQQPERGAVLVPMIEAAWRHAVDIGERPDLPDTVQGRGSFLPAHNLAVLYEALNRRDEARYWREREQALRGALS